MLSFPVRIRLGGHAATTGELLATGQTPSQRAYRTIGTLVGFLLLAAVAFIVPPHIPWALVVLATGLLFARREWTSEYRVGGLRGQCPRCGADLKIKAGEGVRFPLKLTCFNCHHEPVVTLEG
jgi:hypothetical protein